MADERYYCSSCQWVTYFNSRRKTHPCPLCSREMYYLGHNQIVGGTLYNAFIAYDKKELIIPDGVETLEWGAFRDETNLERVVLPPSLKEIPSYCFSNDFKLKNVDVPGSVKTIEQYAFKGCTALERAILSDGVESIGAYAFYGCSGMQFVKFPSTLKVIGECAFGACMPSKIIALPKSISEIGEDAFVVSADRTLPVFLVEAGSFAETYAAKRGYKYRTQKNIEGSISNEFVYRGKLSAAEEKELIISDGVETLEWGAFQGKTNLEQVVLPSSLKEIPGYCFSNDSKLKNVTVPGSVKTIEQNSFEGCTALEKVILSYGVENIEVCAFSGCSSMQFVKFPSTLKVIGACAFRNCMPSKIIALPKNISEIGEDAFVVSADRSLPVFLVEEGSFAEKFVAKRGYKYRTLENVEGFISSEFVCGGKLFAAEKSDKAVEISSDVAVIASGAFEGHTELEQVAFPSAVVEIQSYAFAGCTGIKELTFQVGIQKIGEKAFYDTDVQEVDLPASIESLAPDAFPPQCVISVGGEMPFYGKKLEALKKCREELAVKKERLTELKQTREAIEAQMDEFAKNRPEELDQIHAYQDQVAHIQEQISAQKKEFDKRHERNTSQQQTCQNELNALKMEREKCFFLAVSKKKNLDEKIAEKENELQTILNCAEHLRADETKTMERQKRELDAAEVSLERLLAMNEWRNGVLQRKKLSAESTTAEIVAYTSTIAATEDRLLHEENDLKAAHSAWQDAKEKLAAERKQAEIARKQAELEAEIARKQAELAAEEERRKRELQKKIDDATAKKARLLKKIGKPKYQVEKLYEYIPGEAIVEECLINQCFLDMLSNQNETNRVAAYRSFVEKHSKELEQIRELNRALGCAENDGIKEFIAQDGPKPIEVKLPERFITLNAYFGKIDSWKQVRRAAQTVQKGKQAKLSVQEQLFGGVDYLEFSGTKNTALLFPYCLVVCEQGKQLKVLSYDKVKASVESTEREIECSENTPLPPHGELLSERRKYLNKDGSQNMRYKNNPIVKVLRFTSITILAEEECVEFPVDSRDGAIQFKDAFHQHVEMLCNGIQKGIYIKVCASEEMDNIQQAITELSVAEKKRKDLERKNAEAERRRIERERLAAQLAAEEKRKAIIQRQREINEERKRQEREKEAASRQLAKLFDDDFKDGQTVELTQSKDLPNLPIEVVGNRLISNTVFKITIRAICSISFDEITACFVSKTGMPISNRKKLAGLSDEEHITLGFVLDSGVDYTTMNECFLRLDSQNGTLGDIAFRMNISFCSDF